MSYRLPNSFSSHQQVEALLMSTQQLKTTDYTTPQNWPENVQEFAQVNTLREMTPAINTKLVSFLKSVLVSSPQLSLVMASMPTGDEITELTGWFRSHVHPQAVLHIAQNSDLIAGCILRTDSSVYDLSLRTSLFDNSHKLAERLQHA